MQSGVACANPGCRELQILAMGGLSWVVSSTDLQSSCLVSGLQWQEKGVLGISYWVEK